MVYEDRYPSTIRTTVALALMIICTVSAAFAGKEKRLQRALEWPRADLSEYTHVYVEDCRITDPKAGERKIQGLLESAPRRMADYIARFIDRDLFSEVERREAEVGESGLIVRVELTQYKPGSQAARTLLIGTSSARLTFVVHLHDAASGEEIQSFAEERDFVAGGLHGGTRGITLMEQKAATEIAAYLSLSKGADEATILDKLKNVELLGPPDTEHAVIYVMRPQGFVGAAVRFRIGIGEVTIGESKRNTYHVVYAPPGEHQLWYGNDKKKKYRPLTVEAGKTYYVQAMTMKEVPPKKGAKKLKDCRLAGEIDVTEP